MDHEEESLKISIVCGQLSLTHLYQLERGMKPRISGAYTYILYIRIY